MNSSSVIAIYIYVICFNVDHHLINIDVYMKAYNKGLEHIFVPIESENAQILDLHNELLNERKQRLSANLRRVRYTIGSDKLNFLLNCETLYVS